MSETQTTNITPYKEQPPATIEGFGKYLSGENKKLSIYEDLLKDVDEVEKASIAYKDALAKGQDQAEKVVDIMFYLGECIIAEPAFAGYRNDLEDMPPYIPKIMRFEQNGIKKSQYQNALILVKHLDTIQLEKTLAREKGYLVTVQIIIKSINDNKAKEKLAPTLNPIRDKSREGQSIIIYISRLCWKMKCLIEKYFDPIKKEISKGEQVHKRIVALKDILERLFE